MCGHASAVAPAGPRAGGAADNRPDRRGASAAGPARRARGPRPRAAPTPRSVAPCGGPCPAAGRRAWSTGAARARPGPRDRGVRRRRGMRLHDHLQGHRHPLRRRRDPDAPHRFPEPVPADGRPPPRWESRFRSRNARSASAAAPVLRRSAPTAATCSWPRNAMSSAAGSSNWRASWLKSRAQSATGLNPINSRGPGARTRQPAAAPSSSCWSASRSAATNLAGPGMCGRPASAALNA